MKRVILYVILFSFTSSLHASEEQLEWVRKVDRTVLSELDASSGDYTSLKHHLEYAKKIRIPYSLAGVLIYGKDRGYCIYELKSRRCVILAPFGKRADMAYESRGLKPIGWQILRSKDDKKTAINYVFGRIFEIVDKEYSISTIRKGCRQTYHGGLSNSE